MRSNVPNGKKSRKIKMRSNMVIGKKLTKIQNAQQGGHWKKIEKNSKCAAMWPSEKKDKN